MPCKLPKLPTIGAPAMSCGKTRRSRASTGVELVAHDEEEQARGRHVR